jgi:Exportin-T
VEQWITWSTSPRGEERHAGTAQLQRFRTECPSSVVVPILTALLTRSTHESACFYALSEICLLPRESLSPKEHNELLRFLLTNSSGVGTNGGDGGRLSPPHLRNKAAWLLATWLLQSRWESFEVDLRVLAGSNPLLFLKTVDSLLELLVSTHERWNDASFAAAVADAAADDVQHSVQQPHGVGDVNSNVVTPENVRATRNLLKSGLAEGLCELILANLSSATAAFGTDRTTEVVVLALRAIQSLFLVDMAALSVVTVNRVLEYLLVHALNPSTSPSAVQLAALQVWNEWIHSGIEADLSSKQAVTAIDADNGEMALVLDQRQLDILGALFETIHESNLLPTAGESNADIEVVIEIAKLVSHVGLCLVPLLRQCKQQQGQVGAYAEQLQARMNQVLDLFFRSFAYDDIDVSSAVIPLASALVKAMDPVAPGRASTENASTGIRQHIPQMLNILYTQLKYPPDYDHEAAANSDDDVDAEEQLYRDELCKLYTKFVRVQPALCLQFVFEAASQWLAVDSRSLSSPEDVEATLRLVFHYAEGAQPSPGVKSALEDATFVQLLVAVQSHDLVRRFASTSNVEVLMLYYDIVVRYSALFHEHPDLLSPLLEAISGMPGVQHPNARVRSRCCFLMLRLVSSLTKLLRAYVETAVSGIQQLLTTAASHPQWLRDEDVMYLFETIGILVGRTGVDAFHQQQYLTALLTPHVRAMEEVLAKPDFSRDIQEHGVTLSSSISAISHLSKGFSRQTTPGVQSVLVETVRVTVRVVEALPSCEPVRNKSMVLIQRMIQCIGREALPFCPSLLHCWITHCTSDDILFVSQVFNQLCAKFKNAATDAINTALLPFLHKCQSVVPQVDSQDASSSGLPPHLRTEQLSIQKLAYAVLLAIVTNEATPVLLTPTNVGSLELVLRTVSDGATRARDGVVQRTCIKFFRELVRQWGQQPFTTGDESMYRRATMSFVIQVFLVEMLRTCLDAAFNLQDANQSRCVSELSHVLLGCLQYDPETTRATVSSVLPGSRERLILHPSLSAEQLEKSMRELLVEFRQRSSLT